MAQVTRRTIRSPWSTGIPEYAWRHRANIAAHGAVGTTNIDDPAETLPPGFLHFLDPEVLLPFPIDDPEAEDQLNL